MLEEIAEDSQRTEFRDSTALNSRLQLIRQRQNGKLMEKRLTFGLWHAERPAPTVEILRVLPERLHALAEDVHGVAQADLMPGVIVIDAVEGRDVCDVLVQDVQPVGVGGVARRGCRSRPRPGCGGVVIIMGLGVPIKPYRPAVLKGQRPEFADDVLVEGFPGSCCGVQRRGCL